MENNVRYSEEELMARLKFFIGICLSLTLFGIVFVVLYSLIFVTQPLNAISPIDQKFFELIVPIATFLTGTLSGIMLAGTKKEDQEAMLAAQNAGMGMGNALGGATGAAVGAGTGALLSGGDVSQAIIGGLAGYGTRLGMNLGLDATGRVVNAAGDVIADSYNQLENMMGDQYGDQEGDFPTTPEDLAAADTELGGLPSINEGDQPGDFPQTQEELNAADNQLAAIAAMKGIAIIST